MDSLRQNVWNNQILTFVSCLQPSADRSQCVRCPLGHASNGTRCEVCPSGFFGGNGTFAECARCPVSTYATSNATDYCAVCPSKADTRGQDAQQSASACLCSGNPDNAYGGNYNASLFYTDGYNEDALEDITEAGLFVSSGADHRPIEVISCWKDGGLLSSASASRAAAHHCVVCPDCYQCSETTGSEPHPMPGFWRKSTDSPKAHTCTYAYGCLGGRDSACNESYTGALSNSCPPCNHMHCMVIYI
jgi:hypothetical protein